MDQTQTDRSKAEAETSEPTGNATPSDQRSERTLRPQAGGGTCSCGGAPAANPNGTDTAGSYVYALGRVEPRIPTPAVEKEFDQATARLGSTGLTDRQALHNVLSQRQNRYLARQLCYVLSIEGIETYILQPRDSADLDLLVEAIRPAPTPLDVDVVIGVRGPLAPPEMCNGLMVPIAAFDQLYSFDRETLMKSIPRPEKVAAKQFETASAELFERVLQLADNAGATDEHRALNYLVVRYAPIYALTAERYSQDNSLTAVDVRPSSLSGIRKIVDVIFSFTNRNTDVTDKYFARVDVTEAYPFLVSKLAPYYER